MNARGSIILVVPALAACFEGGSPLGHPCESSDECGAGLVCDPGGGRCVEPGSDTGTTTQTTTPTSETAMTASGSESVTASVDVTGDPATSTTSPETSVGSETMGSCVESGCPCQGDETCGAGLVCRDEQCAQVVCGDDLVEGDEVCEDGNVVDDDGCDADCSWTDFEITPGYNFTCVTFEGGRVRCWGDNDFGQLGRGNELTIGDEQHPWEISDVMMPFGVDRVALGTVHVCGHQSGTSDLLCWGSGTNGALGNVDTIDLGDDELLSGLPAVDIGIDVASTACGDAHCCALSTAASVRCWGTSNNGALGYGNVAQIGDDETPASAGDVAVGALAVEICAGHQTCALLSTGDMKCWGYNAGGDLGNGNVEHIGDNETPDSVPPLDFGEAVTDIACGWGITCALVESGSVRCWGAGGDGSLGQGMTMNLGDNEPATGISPIALGAPALAVTTGRTHACALLDDQTVRCWGTNGFGELGLGHTERIGDDEIPTDVDVVEIGEPVLSLRSGGYVNCVELEGRRIKCWGWNQFGQAGYGHAENLGDDEEPWELPDVQLFEPAR